MQRFTSKIPSNENPASVSTGTKCRQLGIGSYAEVKRDDFRSIHIDVLIRPIRFINNSRSPYIFNRSKGFLQRPICIMELEVLSPSSQTNLQKGSSRKAEILTYDVRSFCVALRSFCTAVAILLSFWCGTSTPFSIKTLC